MFFEHIEQAFPREGFGEDVIHAWCILVWAAIEIQNEGEHTMLEIELNIVTSDIRGHSNDGSPVKLTDQMTGRNTVQIRHNDIHENEVVLRPVLDFIHRF